MRPFVASIMVSPLKEIREDESLPSPFSNFHKYVCQKASRRKKGIHTNCEAGRHCFCVRFTSHKHIEIFFSSKMLKGNEEETNFYWQFKKVFAFGHLSVVKYLQIVTPRLSSCFSLLVITKLFGRKYLFKQRVGAQKI